MKHMRTNMKKLLTLLCIIFSVLALYFVYAVNTYGGRWFTNPYNQRLQNERADVVEGSILDINGEVLAYSDDTGRHYNADTQLRKAVGHTVGDAKGMTGNGAESFLAKYLLGFDQNLFARVSASFSGQPRRGSDVTLTIDSKLCKYILEQMGEYNGAVVLLNYQTGEVIASVSKPSFDPENVDQYKSSQGDEASALVNRATMGKYTPGSVFKVITAAASLRYGRNIEQTTWDCDGPMLFDALSGQYLPLEHIDPAVDKQNREAAAKAAKASADVQTQEAVPVTADTLPAEPLLLRDYASDYHGEISLKRAIAVSCNNVFGKLALELGAKKISKMAMDFGIGVNFMFDDIVLYNSVYDPGDTDYTLAWSGVGQYKDIVTPMQMAMVAAAIANDGVMLEPKLLRSVGTKLVLDSKVFARPITGKEADTLTTYMRYAVTNGTAKSASVKNLPVCGKTGTAEVSSDKSVGNHAWFLGFIDDTRYPFAIATVLEYAGGGGAKAAPLAGKVLAKVIK